MEKFDIGAILGSITAIIGLFVVVHYFTEEKKKALQSGAYHVGIIVLAYIPFGYAYWLASNTIPEPVFPDGFSFNHLFSVIGTLLFWKKAALMAIGFVLSGLGCLSLISIISSVKLEPKNEE